MAALSLRKKKIFALAVLTVAIDENVNVNTGTIFWVRRILQERKRYSLYNKLTNETSKRFKHLLSLVGPHLQRTTTRVREPISAAERLVLALRFFASGGSQQSLCFSFGISWAAICTILRKTCESLWEVLSSSCVRAPNTVLEWKKISRNFSIYGICRIV